MNPRPPGYEPSPILRVTAQILGKRLVFPSLEYVGNRPIPASKVSQKVSWLDRLVALTAGLFHPLRLRPPRGHPLDLGPEMRIPQMRATLDHRGRLVSKQLLER